MDEGAFHQPVSLSSVPEMGREKRRQSCNLHTPATTHAHTHKVNVFIFPFFVFFFLFKDVFIS